MVMRRVLRFINERFSSEGDKAETAAPWPHRLRAQWPLVDGLDALLPGCVQPGADAS